MDEQTDITVRAAVNHTDTMAIAKNVATNGRLFCILLVAVNIAAGHHAMAIISALPVGLSVIAEQGKVGWPRYIATLAIYGLAAIAAILSLVQVW